MMPWRHMKHQLWIAAALTAFEAVWPFAAAA